MTEYELVDAISAYATQGGTFFSFWLTILSAYAITAYVAGKDLSSMQILWLNCLYLFAVSLVIFGFEASWSSQVHYISKLKEIAPDAPQKIRSEIVMLVTVIAALGTIATLKFMWDIRHPKTEKSL